MNKLFGPTHYSEEELADEGFRSLGRNVRIARNCTIIGAENIAIGDNVRIDGYCTLVAAGSGYINLGSYIHIGGYCALLASEGITMEDMTTISWGVRIFTRSDDFSGEYMTNPTVPAKYTNVSGGAVVLKRHAIVGSNSAILPKVTLEEGAAVGALSLVTKSLAPWGIYTGIPAKHLKARSRKLLERERDFLAEVVTNEKSLRNQDF
ncbi:MAG: acyltransferase [Gammaproteobacteria bacterium]